MAPPDPRLRVGIVGATGLVGQRLVSLLDSHPWFEVGRLAASERSDGKTYGEAVRWSLDRALPGAVAAIPMDRCRPESFVDCDVVLSALDATVAREVERPFVEAGHRVVSNSSAHRMDPDVPLVVPEVNGDHLRMLEGPAGRGDGFLATNPNCSVIGLAIALAPLHETFGIRRVVVTTMQALSGAGLDGPRALALIDNVVPYIAGEEEKIEIEIGKLLGTLSEDATRVRPLEIPVSAHCHRVGTIDGHLEAVSVELEREASAPDVVACLGSYRGRCAEARLPSAPDPVVVVREEPDRPQPRLDRNAGGGMAVVVGRIRPCPALGIRFEVLSHNTIRGAAGAALLIAESLAARGWLRSVRRR